MVLTSKDISNPSHSAKAALHRGVETPETLGSAISTAKLKVVKGLNTWSGISAPLRHDPANAGLQQTHGQELQRLGGRYFQLDDEASLIDRLRWIQTIIDDHLKGVTFSLA